MPLPSTDAEQSAEHAARVAAERAEAAERGLPRVRGPGRVREPSAGRGAGRPARRPGLRSVARYRYLLLGANDEDAATALAEQVRGLAGGATVTVEASGRAIEEAVAPNPFAIFGGLGG